MSALFLRDNINSLELHGVLEDLNHFVFASLFFIYVITPIIYHDTNKFWLREVINVLSHFNRIFKFKHDSKIRHIPKNYAIFKFKMSCYHK